MRNKKTAIIFHSFMHMILLWPPLYEREPLCLCLLTQANRGRQACSSRWNRLWWNSEWEQGKMSAYTDVPRHISVCVCVMRSAYGPRRHSFSFSTIYIFLPVMASVCVNGFGLATHRYIHRRAHMLLHCTTHTAHTGELSIAMPLHMCHHPNVYVLCAYTECVCVCDCVCDIGSGSLQRHRETEKPVRTRTQKTNAFSHLFFFLSFFFLFFALLSFSFISRFAISSFLMKNFVVELIKRNERLFLWSLCVRRYTERRAARTLAKPERQRAGKWRRRRRRNCCIHTRAEWQRERERKKPLATVANCWI